MKQQQLPVWIAWLVLLAEGFVSVSLQVIFFRQLEPFVGGGAVIYGLLVGCFLAALAVGYKLGGSRVNSLNSLAVNFAVAAIYIGLTCSYVVTEKAFLLMAGIGTLEMQAALFFVVVMMPPVILLAQTLPLMTGMIHSGSVSGSAGTALSRNTVGSIVGAVVTPIVLFHYFGIGWSVFINVLLLVALWCLTGYYSKNSRLSFFLAIPVVVASALSYKLNVEAEKVTFIKATEYANYSIREDADERGYVAKILELNKTAASVLANESTLGYISFMRDYMKTQLGFVDNDVLVLGSGGFTFSYLDDTKNRYTYIDIDPAIKAIAEKFFLQQGIKGRFLADDARHYIATSQDFYDLIVIDLYTNPRAMPWHVTTVQFLESVADRLNDGGYVMLNLVQRVGFDDSESKRMHATINTVFDYCYAVPLLRGKQEIGNVAYICKKPTGDTVYRNVDDRVMH